MYFFSLFARLAEKTLLLAVHFLSEQLFSSVLFVVLDCFFCLFCFSLCFCLNLDEICFVFD